MTMDPNTKDEAFIRTEDVTFSYGDTVPDDVLKGIVMHVEKGEFVALLGHNGSGKSTLAKMFNAMLLPTGGAIYAGGMDTKDESLLYEIRRRVGLVLQNPDNQLVASVVEEDVAFGPENLGVPTEEIRKRVDDALKAVEMYDFREFAPHKLSGGQKQRVAIAGIIAMEPDCIVLDEPTAMLDPRGRTEVLRTIHRLNREKGITIVLITHYMDEAIEADRVIVMDDGKILIEGAPRDVFSQVELLKKHQLDVPQSTELTHRLKAAGVELPECTLSIDECVAALESLRPEFSHAGSGGEGEGGAEHAAD
ncbi:MAG: energy-coupling factor transporter ATPase [Hydrogeniiclostridium sp.]